MSNPTIPEDLLELFESSKKDKTLFVGSEIRHLIWRIAFAEASRDGFRKKYQETDAALDRACKDVADLQIENARLKQNA